MRARAPADPLDHAPPGVAEQRSLSAYLRLRERFTFEKRGPITVKGKGELVTYFLLGREAKASPPS
ncbi:MAG: hypothetical protein H0U86_15735 [Chloroflexi bacterium]|nr:hypothetical protein [Chloroflexota bacterium]